jgi:hypothetical protein
MGILDEAIKEHLELKRQHGAGESELKQLEDEAFGAAERPGAEEVASDALAEAPTAFMAQPEAPEADDEEASARRRPAPHVADLQEAPAGPTTEERQAIAEQPTEMYDVEEELAGPEPQAPSEEELVEEEIAEPRLGPVDPLAAVEEAEDVAPEVEVADEGDASDADLDDEFWDEKRLSDELDQALEAPRETESEPEGAEPPTEAEAAPPAEAEDAWEETPSGSDEDVLEETPSGSDEDVLEETPDFLEEAPEDDQLWFEQKPPKDFDFDD